MGHHHADEGIAIVGMGCLFPGAPDLDAFWRVVRDGVDCIADVPRGRWDPSRYDPAADAPERFYCRRGGFVDEHARFDALGFGVMPIAAQGAEPDQLLSLSVASRALADAGYDQRAFSRERAGVILGRGGYMGAGLARAETHVRVVPRILQSLSALVPGISADELARVRDELLQGVGPFGADTAIGLVPNLAASRIANRLDLHGPAYTVDAACASALLAVDHAVTELRSRRCDLVLAGGAHLCHDATLWSVFCQLGALSRSQQIRPFDRRADGLLIGEGVGIVVLRRHEDALRDGDRIYAVIRGVGVSSDGRAASLMQPSVEGQLMALSRAWSGAGLDPATLGLLEAHGTGTPVGDAAELTTVGRCFAEAADPVIGSVKANIGHAMPAAGAAGLIKAALAVHHGELPPSLHCEEPSEALARSPFRTLSRAQPWEGPVRRAGVNAFGFGGINAHVVLEAVTPGAPRRVARPEQPRTRVRLALYAADSVEALLVALDEDRESTAATEGPVRLAIVDPTPERRGKARRIVERGTPWRSGRHGVWFSPEPLAASGGKVAFLFPGVDASFEPRVDDVAELLGRPAPRSQGEGLEAIGRGIVEVSRLLFGVLTDLGVRADMMAGHSIGEWTALIASGAIPEDAVDPFIETLVPGSLEVPGVVFAAAGCGVERADEAIEGLPEIAVSHDNCPHQLILCGREDSIDTAMARLREEGVLCQKLPFRSGFHSPLFEAFVEPHREHFARLPLQAPRTPFYSATSCEPYPDDPEAIRALALSHLVRPVRFREVVERLHDDGARVFIQVGTGSLVGFVGDTLRDRPHVAIGANVPKRSGVEQLVTLAAALWVEGYWPRLDRLPVETAARAQDEPRGVMLSLGVPEALPRTPLAVAAPALPDLPDDGSPLAVELQATLREIDDARRQIAEAFQGRRATRPKGPRERIERRVVSVQSFPQLLDHCFYRQPEGWRDTEDRFPVVPMTTSVSMMIEAARELVPERVPVALLRVRAYRWIAVAPPVELEIRARFDGEDRVDVSIEGYASATVMLADGYPPAPAPAPFRLENERPAPVSADRLYEDRWMFHGPAFQGVRELGPMGDDGIAGVLAPLPTPGALLDNAGQLFGFWVMRWVENDRLAFPVQVERMEIFGPEPTAGDVGCQVRIVELADDHVKADLQLTHAGRVWMRITGWDDRRFDSDPELFEVLRFPETLAFAARREEGYCLAREVWRTTASRELIARRYLGRDELSVYEEINPRRQRAWLLGRIAVKDAVRRLLWERGHGPLFPVEIQVDNDPDGRPRVRAPGGLDLRVSIAHKPEVAVALVREGREVGIDIERIEPRSADFEAISMTERERAMLPEEGRDELVTRIWVAKEAVAKASGTGLSGNPRRFEVTDVVSDRLLVDGRWVTTRREGDCIVGWTES